MRILVSNPDTIGDFVLREPLLRALQAAGHELMLIVRESVAPLARLVAPGSEVQILPLDPYAQSAYDAPAEFFERCAAWSPELLVVAPYQWTQFEVRLADELADVPGVRFNGHPYDPLGMGAGAPEAAPLEETTAMRAMRPMRPMRVVEVAAELHEVAKNERLACAILDREVQLPPPALRGGEWQLQAAAERLRQAGLQPGEFWVACVGHTPETAIKNWTPEAWAQTLAHGARAHGTKYALIGAPSERAVSETIRVAMGECRSHASVVIGDGGVDLAVGILELSRGYIGRDTGPMHMAAALGKPVLAVFGGGHWPRFTPVVSPSFAITVGLPCFGCDFSCSFERSHCLKAIPPAEMCAAIDRLEAGELTRRETRVLEPGAELLRELLHEGARETRRLRQQLGRLERAYSERAELETVNQRLIESELRLEQRLAQAYAELSRANTEAQDARVELAQAVADRDALAAYVAQRLNDRRPVNEEIGDLRGRLADAEARRMELETRCREVEDLASKASHYRQCIVDLQKSRWRQIGLRLGVARLAAWEKNGEKHA